MVTFNQSEDLADQITANGTHIASSRTASVPSNIGHKEPCFELAGQTLDPNETVATKIQRRTRPSVERITTAALKSRSEMRRSGGVVEEDRL